MEVFYSILKLLLALFLANTFQYSDAIIDFQRMANHSRISIERKMWIKLYPEILLEVSENVAIYKLKDADESIKVLYAIQNNIKELFRNEAVILKRLNKKLKNNSIENGIVKLIDSGNAEWYTDEIKLPGRCFVVVYTYGKPLFPVLKKCVKNNERKKLFWYFWQMAKSMCSIQYKGRISHNNIEPNVFRLTTNGEVFVDNFEIARSLFNSRAKSLCVTENGFPIGFKPTMSYLAMIGEKRSSECEYYSFEMTSYYMMHDRLPWQMDAIDFLWNVNITEAFDLTLVLRKIDLEAYHKFIGTWNSIHFDIESAIRVHRIDFETLSEEFHRLYDESIE